MKSWIKHALLPGALLGTVVLLGGFLLVEERSRPIDPELQIQSASQARDVLLRDLQLHQLAQQPQPTPGELEGAQSALLLSARRWGDTLDQAVPLRGTPREEALEDLRQAIDYQYEQILGLHRKEERLYQLHEALRRDVRGLLVQLHPEQARALEGPLLDLVQGAEEADSLEGARVQLKLALHRLPEPRAWGREPGVLTYAGAAVQVEGLLQRSQALGQELELVARERSLLRRRPTRWAVKRLLHLQEARLEEAHAQAQSWRQLFYAMLGAVFLGLMLLGMRLAGFYGKQDRRLRQRAQALEDARQALGSVQRQKNALWEGAQQGFFWMNHQGELPRDPSPGALRWWGTPEPQSSAMDWLGQVDNSFARRLEDALQVWHDEGNPLDRLPMALHSQQRDWALSYTHVLHEGEEALILVSALEVTDTRRCRVLEERQGRMEAALRSLSQDRSALVAFYQEARALVEGLAGAGMADALSQRQRLYALEGEASFAGVEHLARLCKQMSRALYTEDRVLLRSERLALKEAWQQWESLAQAAISPAERWLEVPRDQAERVLKGLDQPDGPREAALALLRWTRTPVQDPLDRLAARVRHIAAERGMHLRVQIEAQADLYLETQLWAPFWGAALHVANNCLDHGLETAQERLSAGKSAEGRLVLSMSAVQDRLIFRVSDDGRGIDWRRVAELARIAGLPHGDRETLVEALFHDGLSTGGAEGYCAGLGLGLGSAREAAARLGGSLSVQSASGAGTDVLFSFPLSMALLPRLPEAPPRVAAPAPVLVSPALEPPRSRGATGDMAALRKSLDED